MLSKTQQRSRQLIHMIVHYRHLQSEEVAMISSELRQPSIKLTSAWPAEAAQSRGVQPLLSTTCTPTPRASSSLVMLMSPVPAADSVKHAQVHEAMHLQSRIRCFHEHSRGSMPQACHQTQPQHHPSPDSSSSHTVQDGRKPAAAPALSRSATLIPGRAGAPAA